VRAFPSFSPLKIAHMRLSVEDHARQASLSRNRVSNMSFAICSLGEVLILAVMVGILKGIKSDESTENNTKAFSVLIAFSGGVWRTFLNQVLRQVEF
jgi:cytochrome bd-type quinol oxidase subunit 2